MKQTTSPGYRRVDVTALPLRQSAKGCRSIRNWMHSVHWLLTFIFSGSTTSCIQPFLDVVLSPSVLSVGVLFGGTQVSDAN